MLYNLYWKSLEVMKLSVKCLQEREIENQYDDPFVKETQACNHEIHRHWHSFTRGLF